MQRGGTTYRKAGEKPAERKEAAKRARYAAERGAGKGENGKRHAKGTAAGGLQTTTRKQGKERQMTFRKGQSGNPKGRPKGAAGKRTKRITENVSRLLESMEEQVRDDLRQLEPNERVKAYTALLSYAIPKKASITAEAKIQSEFSHLAALLQSAPESAVIAIAEKVMSMQAEQEEINAENAD